MGSLSGHILPGSFFLVFGCWWSWSIFHKYFFFVKEATRKSQEILTMSQKRNIKYRNSVSFPCFLCYKIPIEGYLKVAAAIIGMIGEFIGAFKNGVFTHYGNVQHMTMYFYFGLNGLMEVLSYHGWSLLPDLDFMTGILAFVMEGFLFYFHLDGSKPMEYRLHIFLVLLIVASVVSCICEMMYRESVFSALSRAYFVILQGTWFYQIGFILYVYNWKDANSNQIKMVTYIFSWHVAIVFIFLLLLGYAVRRKISRCKSSLPIEVFYSLERGEKSCLRNDDHLNIELSSSDEI